MKKMSISVIMILSFVFMFTNISAAENAFKHSTLSKSQAEYILKRAKQTNDKFDPVIPKFYVCMFYGNLMKNTMSYGKKLKRMVTISVKEGNPFAGVVAGSFMYLVYRDSGMPMRAKRIQRKAQPAFQGAMNKYGKKNVREFVDTMTQFYNEYFDIPEDKIDQS